MTRRWLIAAPGVLTAILLLAACGEAPSDEHVTVEPATVEHIDGTQLARVTLTEPAAERLDIQTASVEAEGQRLIVPSSAVLVEPDGEAWVYTNPQPLAFVRHQITVDRETGGLAYLSSGPPEGTTIVTVGAAELYGAEFGVGH
jgi:hypothetical protein